MNENEISKTVVDCALRIHKELGGLKLGLLINFGEALMKDGITRLINGQL